MVANTASLKAWPRYDARRSDATSPWRGYGEAYPCSSSHEPALMVANTASLKAWPRYDARRSDATTRGRSEAETTTGSLETIRATFAMRRKTPAAVPYPAALRTC